MSDDKKNVNEKNSLADPGEYLTSCHKKLFLRFITAHTNFLDDPKKFPDYLRILAADLNLMGFKRNQQEWLQTLQSWIDTVEGSINTDGNIMLSAEDERLLEHLKQIESWVEPTLAELSCIVNNLEELGDLPNLWKAVADKFHRANKDNPDRYEYWRKIYYHITNTVVAKKDLIEYIEANHSDIVFDSPQLGALNKLEIRILRLRPQLSLSNTFAPLDLNISTFCRICLASSSSSMTYLYDENRNNMVTLLDKLNYCACLTSTPCKGDGLPEYLCTSCCVLLESTYQLKLLCLKTEAKLMGAIIQVENGKQLEPAYTDADMHNVCEYKQIQIIETMDQSDEDESKKIYLVTSEEIDENDGQPNMIVHVDHNVKDDEMNEDDSQHEFYEIVESQEDLIDEEIDEAMAKANEDSEALTCPEEFHCNSCQLIFKTESKLTAHMRTHDSSKKHECSNCKKNFKTRLSLTIHMRSHTGERPYVCETCGKAFKTVSAVNNHRAIHSEVKEFSCQYCPYSASTKANLKIHDRTHSGVQPYGCRYCPMKFSTASNMHKHIRNIHEKLKTHKCDQCDRFFFTRESARKHMVTHTGLKPYTCTQCPMAYGWYNGLKKHVKMQHANIKIPTETSFYNKLKNKS